MKGAWSSIIALLIAVFFMVMGSGILGTLIPLSAKAHGFGPAEIGLLGSSYFGGMLFGAMIATRALQRIGHVRVLTACMVLGASSTLGLALHANLWLWLALRFLIGLAFAGLYATIESWLQGKAEDSIRGRVLSTYSVVQFAGWGLGNQLIGLADPTSFALFSIASIVMCIAILPLVLPDIDPPAPPGPVAPVGPVTLNPGEPVGPVGPPKAPVAPCGPVIPLAPVGPVRLNPIGPVGP